MQKASSFLPSFPKLSEKDGAVCGPLGPSVSSFPYATSPVVGCPGDQQGEKGRLGDRVVMAAPYYQPLLRKPNTKQFKLLVKIILGARRGWIDIWFSLLHGTFLVIQIVKNLPAMRETWIQSLGQDDPLEKGRATDSSILAWRIPWGLRVGQDWVTNPLYFMLSWGSIAKYHGGQNLSKVPLL